MPTKKYFPGDYFVDGAEYQLVLCKKTGLYYGSIDGEIDFSSAYASLHEILRDRHPALTSTTGKQRCFSVKNKVRILNELLTVWERRGYGFGGPLLPFGIPVLTPEQLAISGPQPRAYTMDLLLALDRSPSPSPARGKRPRDSGEGSASSPAPSGKRARVGRAAASEPAPKSKSRAVSSGEGRALSLADSGVSFSVAHMRSARRARKSTQGSKQPPAPPPVKGRSLTLSQYLADVKSKNKKRKTPASARAQPSTGGRARVLKTPASARAQPSTGGRARGTKLGGARASSSAGGRAGPPSKARSGGGSGAGGSGAGGGYPAADEEYENLRAKGILFRADFTNERFIQTVMYPREADKAVTKLLEDQQVDQGYTRETYVRAREWYQAVVAGLDRMIVRVEGMDFADQMESEEREREREERERRQLPVQAVVQAAEQEVETFLAAGGGFRPSSPTYPHPHDKPFDPTKTYKDPTAPPLPDSSEDEAENGSPPDGPGKRAIVVKTQPADD